jgi:UDP-glucose 4-epimerase
MQILITGGLGHIGSFFINKIINNNKVKSIILIDNLSTQRYVSLLNLKNKSKIRFVNEDVSKFNFKNINNKIDIVIHLAAITNAEASFNNKKKLIKNNLGGTRKIVDFCKKNNAKLIFSSSTSVYGKQFKVINSSNNYKNLRPQSPYAECKILEENIIKKNLKNYIILRFGTIVGISHGMRFHTAINKFCYQACMGEPLTVWKSFYFFKRPYLTINDCANSIIFFTIYKKNYNGLFDVVTENLHLKKIIQKIRNLKKIKINFTNTKILNQNSYHVKSDLIKKLGFAFVGSVDVEINKLIKHIGNFKIG